MLTCGDLGGQACPKRCPRCGHDKPVSDFGKDSSNRDGLKFYCRECIKEASSKYRAEHKEDIRKSRKKYYQENKKTVLRKNAEWHKNNSEKVAASERKRYAEHSREILEHNRNHDKNNPEKIKAKHKVYDAIISGKIVRPKKCSMDDGTCRGKIEAHHHDYSKPLDVVWVCRSHHHRIHLGVISLTWAAEVRDE